MLVTERIRKVRSKQSGIRTIISISMYSTGVMPLYMELRVDPMNTRYAADTLSCVINKLKEKT